MTEGPSAQDGAGPAVGRLWLVYTALRLVVFLGTAAVGYLFGLTGFPLVLLALLVSSIVSLFALRSQREALVAAQLARRERRVAEREALRARLGEDSQE